MLVRYRGYGESVALRRYVDVTYLVVSNRALSSEHPLSRSDVRRMFLSCDIIIHYFCDCDVALTT
jgi:hypothetical protein